MTTPSFTLLLERHGGFIGVPMRAELNSADLAVDESQRLWTLVEKALQAPPGSRHPDRRSQRADSFTYRLTVVTSDHQDEYAFDESALGADLRSLVQHLERHLTI